MTDHVSSHMTPGTLPSDGYISSGSAQSDISERRRHTMSHQQKKTDRTQAAYHQAWGPSGASYGGDYTPTQSKCWMGVLYTKKVEKHMRRIENAIAEREDVIYFRGQEEVGRESGKRHIQFFIKFDRVKRNSEVKRALHMDKAYVTPARYPDLAVDYCKKQWTRPDTYWSLEMGQYQSPHEVMKDKALQREAAKRQLREDQFKEMVQVCMQASSKEEAFTTCVDNYWESKNEFATAWEYARAKTEVDTQRRIRSRAEGIEWQPWQQALESYLLNNHDDRRVDCVLDKYGNTGKSYFVRNFLARNPNNGMEVMQGKTENMSAQIANAPFEVKNVFIDLTRFQQENANLTFVEGLKNAVVHNHKYNVFSKHYEHPPNIVVMTNTELEWSHMTKDRWHIWDLERLDDGTVKYTERDMVPKTEVKTTAGIPNAAPTFIRSDRDNKQQELLRKLAAKRQEAISKIEKKLRHKAYQRPGIEVEFIPRPCTVNDDNESECTHL